MSNRAEWLREAKWGVFTHYLADAPSNKKTVELSSDDWNRQIDTFDVKALAAQLAEVNAPYYFMTLGQNSGFFLSPNETYDRIVGRAPSRLSQRDLIADIIEAIEPYGIRMMAYLPSHAPALDREAVEALGWTPRWDLSKTGIRPGTYLAPPDIDERITQGLRNWEAIIKEWSERWGRKVHGWWFDGCYYGDELYRHPDPPNFESFATAARAGNPDSIVAFNPGVITPVITHTEFEDYTAGELAHDLQVGFWDKKGYHAIEGKVEQAQYHVLTYLGEYWGRGKPRFPVEMTIGYTRYVNSHGGAITWDVPIEKSGTIPSVYIDQLKALNQAIG